MSYAAVIGGVAAIGGSAIAGMSAADAADAQAEAMRRAQGDMYQYGNSARFRAMGDFFGGSGLDKRMLGNASDADIDAEFGTGAARYLRLSELQKNEFKQGRAPARRLGEQSPHAANIQEFENYWNELVHSRDPNTWDRESNRPITGDALAQARQARFQQWYQQKTGQRPSMEALAEFTRNPTLQRVADSEIPFDPTKLEEYMNAQGGKGIISEYGDLATKFGQRGKQALFDFDADSGALQAMADRNLADTMTQYKRSANDIYGKATGMESLVKDWGADRGRIIDEDAQRGLDQANAMSQAQLAARGFNGSTLVSNASNANAREFGRNKARAKQDLADSQIDRRTSARGQAVGMYANSLGAMDDTYGKFKGSNIDRAYSRAAQKMAMSQDNMNRDLALEQIPLSLRGNLAMSSLMNPGTTINTASFIPTATGAGMVGSALGSTLAGMGGQAWGSWLAGNGSTNRSTGGYQDSQGYQDHMQWERDN